VLAVLLVAAGIGTALTACALTGVPAPRDDRDVRAIFDGPLNVRGAGAVSYSFYRRLRDRTDRWSRVEAYTPLPVRMLLPQKSGIVHAKLVTPGHFSLLDTRLLLGREFRCEIEARAPCREVTLNAAFWRERFASDPAIDGRTIPIEGRPFVVVGVATAAAPDAPDLWLPLAAAPELTGLPWERADVRWLYVLARPRPGQDDAGVLSLSLSEARMVRLLRVRSGVARHLTAITLGGAALVVVFFAGAAGWLLRSARTATTAAGLLAAAVLAVLIHLALTNALLRYFAGFRIPVLEFDTKLNPGLLAAALLVALLTVAVVRWADLLRNRGGPAV
jgi:hypothetical protein